MRMSEQKRTQTVGERATLFSSSPSTPPLPSILFGVDHERLGAPGTNGGKRQISVIARMSVIELGPFAYRHPTRTNPRLRRLGLGMFDGVRKAHRAIAFVVPRNGDHATQDAVSRQGPVFAGQ